MGIAGPADVDVLLNSGEVASAKPVFDVLGVGTGTREVLPARVPAELVATTPGSGDPVLAACVDEVAFERNVFPSYSEIPEITPSVDNPVVKEHC